MQDKDDMSYEGEPIQLNGKIRNIKYAVVGLKLLAKKYGSVIDAFDTMKAINPKFDEETMDNLTLLLHAGLIHEDPRLTIDDVEKLLTYNNMLTVFNIIIKAFNGSAPQPKDDGGSTDNAGEPVSTST